MTVAKSNANTREALELATRVTALETHLGSIEASMFRIEKKLDTTTKEAKFPVLGALSISIGVAGVTLTLMSLIGKGYVRDMNRIEANQEALKKDTVDKGEWIGVISNSVENLITNQTKRTDNVAEIPVLSEKSVIFRNEIDSLSAELREDKKQLKKDLETLKDALSDRMTLLDNPLKIETAQLREEIKNLRDKYNSTSSTRFTKEDWYKEQEIILNTIKALSDDLKTIKGNT